VAAIAGFGFESGPFVPPEEYLVPQRSVSEAEVRTLSDLVERGVSETEIDRFLRASPPLLVSALALINTGHHGSWVVPQQVIRPPQGSVQSGLKPDFIVGGKSSDGFAWFVVELKGPGDAIFSEASSRLLLSRPANMGVIQLLEYIDYCSQAQAYLRDTLHLIDFREPRGLLLIGRETELAGDRRRQALKAAWNRVAGDRLQIRTYSALVRAARVIWEGQHRRRL